MFPGPVILFALGLNHVALGCQGLVDDSAGNVGILICRERKGT